MDPEFVKAGAIKFLKNQNAMITARDVIERVNENCYQKCVPTPGTSLSKGEETCFSMCVDKYLAGWQKVQDTHMARLQKEI